MASKSKNKNKDVAEDKPEDGNVQLTVKLLKPVEGALKKAKRQQEKEKKLPANKTSIAIQAVTEWLDVHEGKTTGDEKRPNYRGQEDLNISVPVELKDRIKDEVNRREDEKLEPDSIKSLVQCAIIAWLRNHGYEDLITW